MGRSVKNGVRAKSNTEENCPGWKIGKGWYPKNALSILTMEPKIYGTIKGLGWS